MQILQLQTGSALLGGVADYISTIVMWLIGNSLEVHITGQKREKDNWKALDLYGVF